MRLNFIEAKKLEEIFSFGRAWVGKLNLKGVHVPQVPECVGPVEGPDVSLVRCDIRC